MGSTTELGEVEVTDVVGVVVCSWLVLVWLVSVDTPGVVILVTEASARFARKERAALM